ncbi:MAG: hypothetical protein KKA19_09135, partial [Candidatus Margulisbacteria bacterium]|nr:hypothetical protein [Candidatus Margulisiibacteriota bacterium]
CFNKIFINQLLNQHSISPNNWALIDFSQLTEEEIQGIRKYLPLDTSGATIASAYYNKIFYDSTDPETELIKFLKEVEKKQPGTNNLIEYLLADPQKKALNTTLILNSNIENISKFCPANIANYFQYALTGDEKYLFELGKFHLAKNEYQKLLEIINLHQGKYFNEAFLCDLAIGCLQAKEFALAVTILKKGEYKNVPHEKLANILAEFYKAGKKDLIFNYLLQKLGVGEIVKYIIQKDLQDISFLKKCFNDNGDIRLKESIGNYIFGKDQELGERMLEAVYQKSNDTDKQRIASYLTKKTTGNSLQNWNYLEKKMIYYNNIPSSKLNHFDLLEDCVEERLERLLSYGVSYAIWAGFMGISQLVRYYGIEEGDRAYTFGMSEGLQNNINDYNEQYLKNNEKDKIKIISDDYQNHDYVSYRWHTIDELEKYGFDLLNNKYESALASAEAAPVPDFTPPEYRPPKQNWAETNDAYHERLAEYNKQYQEALKAAQDAHQAQVDAKQNVVNGISQEWKDNKADLINYYKTMPHYWYDLDFLELAYLNKRLTQETRFNFKYHLSYYHMYTLSLQQQMKIYLPLFGKYNNINLIPFVEANFVQRGDKFPWQKAATLGAKLQNNFIVKGNSKLFLNLSAKTSLKEKGFNLHPVTEERHDPLDREIAAAVGGALCAQKRNKLNMINKMYMLAGLKQNWTPQTKTIYAQLGTDIWAYNASFIYNYNIDRKEHYLGWQAGICAFGFKQAKVTPFKSQSWLAYEEMH